MLCKNVDFLFNLGSTNGTTRELPSSRAALTNAEVATGQQQHALVLVLAHHAQPLVLNVCQGVGARVRQQRAGWITRSCSGGGYTGRGGGGARAVGQAHQLCSQLPVSFVPLLLQAELLSTECTASDQRVRAGGPHERIESEDRTVRNPQ